MIKYVTGDLFESDLSNTIICHVVNNKLAMGSGFVIPLCKKYPKVKEQYLERKDLSLGDVDLVYVDNNKNTIIANMYAQDGFSNYEGKPNVKPLNYGVLSECLSYVNHIVIANKSYHNELKIVAPLFGAGLSGGDWNVIEELVNWYWCELDVTIFQLPGQEVR